MGDVQTKRPPSAPTRSVLRGYGYLQDWPKDSEYWLTADNLDRDSFAVVLLTKRQGVLYTLSTSGEKGGLYDLASRILYIMEHWNKLILLNAREDIRLFTIRPGIDESDDRRKAADWCFKQVGEWTGLGAREIVYSLSPTAVEIHSDGQGTMPQLYVGMQLWPPLG